MTLKIQLLCIAAVIILVSVSCTAMVGEHCLSLDPTKKVTVSSTITGYSINQSRDLPISNATTQWHTSCFDSLKPEDKKVNNHQWPKTPIPITGHGMFSWRIGIYTNFEGNEKYTPILQSLIDGIDVDNNPETGSNGKDIKIEFLLVPFPDLMDGEWILFLTSFLQVVRLGEEIKYGDFHMYIEFSFTLNSQHTIRIGYTSEKNEEIPKELNQIITITPYIFYDRQPEFFIDMVPLFDGNAHNLSILAEYISQESHQVTIDYIPAVDTEIHLIPHEDKDTIDFSIQRASSHEQKIKIQYEGVVSSLALILEDIPQIMTFTLGFGENIFEYTSTDTFNATLIMAVFDRDLYMMIKYLPQHLKTQFLRQEGYLSISIDDAKTQFILTNDQYNPTKSFTITNLTGESHIHWQITPKEGYVTIAGFQGLEISISLADNTYSLLVTSLLQTEHFEIRWNLNVPGFVFLDTNLQWLNSISFTLLYTTLYGILLEANLLQAEDFQVNWQTTIPLFVKNGFIDFLGDITFQIYLNGTWHPIF